jgi:hypothetical protein
VKYWSNVRDFQRWLWRYFFEVLSFRPGMSCGIISVSLIVHLASIAAFFLPIKILFLLGDDRVPRYFPDALVGMDRDLLILWMVALVGFSLLIVGVAGVFSTI